VLPMLASPTPVSGRLPGGSGWVYEVKWDGIRLLADSTDERLRLLTRTGRDVTVAFPELAALAGLPDALLDGELVAMDDRGIPSFGALAERVHVRDRRRAAALARTAPASYLVFDVLRLYGVDLTGRPWTERRATLDRLELPAGPFRLSPVYEDGEALLAATREQGLEGVVAKKAASTYRPGQRSTAWVKVPHRLSRTCVVGGWRPQTDTTRTVGALLVGAPDADGALHYVGRVGSGIGRAAQRDLAERLAPLTRATSPFAETVPAVDAAGATWVDPELVVEVEHLGWTSGRRLRQPSYRGVRTDHDPDPVEAR